MDGGLNEQDHAAEVRAKSVAMANAVVSAEERQALVIMDLCRHARRDVRATLQGCDLVMEALRDKLPAPVFGSASPYFAGLRAETEVWAEFANDGQIAAMLASCLDRIAGTRLVIDDRKRLLVAIWNSLSADDRRAFRDRVMPKDPSLR